MLASRHFSVTRTDDDDWFDTILDADTELFVDPFLVFKESQGFWSSAHEHIVRHFDRAFALVAEGNRNSASLAYRKALALLVFREPKELCLGYTSQGTAGAGSGVTFSAAIAEAISEAISRGIEHPRHFEELGVLNKGIGSDRISDITCTVLKPRILEYTQSIARRHDIGLDRHALFAASFDERRQRWETPEVRGGPQSLDSLAA